MTTWLEQSSHRRWLDHELDRLLDFGTRLAHPAGGAAWLDDDGAPDLSRGLQTWITARMTHVYSLAVLLGRPGAAALADAALAGLTGPLRDHQNGGWHSSLDSDGTPAPGKSAYDHAFVLLAAGSAALAGRPGARALLDDAASVYLEHFWDERAGMAVDTWDTAWTELEPYRGINANMHALEALLATADVTGDRSWLERATRIAERAVAAARANDWRLPEHYDADWRPDLELNADRPDHPFKPYGATVGHGLEWSRLLLHLEAALGADAPATLLDAAVALFDRAVEDGWAVDDSPGFVYTTDWSGRPVVHDRMHWVPAEAVGAAAALHLRTGEPRFAALYAQWWDYVADHLIDPRGSWHHQLDRANRPVATVWPGKADLYHAVQATLIPRLPLAPTLASAISRGLLP